VTSGLFHDDVVDLRAQLDTLKIDSYYDFDYSVYLNPYNAYVSALAIGLQQISFWSKFLPRRKVWTDSIVLRGKFLTNFEYRSDSVHIATVDLATTALYPYFESMFKNLRFKLNRRLTASERTYWIGRFVLEKIVTHLQSKKEYVYNVGNIQSTAMCVYYNYLQMTSRCPPLIDINNAFDVDDMVLLSPLAYQYTTELNSSALECLDFQFPFAGHVAIEATSLV